MHFPVSGVDVFPLLPPAVAFLVSSITSTAGLSGAFLILPFQISVLGFTSPAVTPTNLIFNIVAIPGGLSRYMRSRRMAWPLAGVIVLGTLPGVLAGAWIRLRYLPNPGGFKFFVGLVLLYLGIRLFFDIFKSSAKKNIRKNPLEKKLQDRAEQLKKNNNRHIAPLLPEEAVVKTLRISLAKIEYEFWGETFVFSPLTIFILALAVGVVGGIYGIGGSAIISPFCVFMGLPIYTVAGAALAGNFVTSVLGVAFFTVLAFTPLGGHGAASPDWMLGVMFGVGGLFGTYVGAYIQKYLPERLIKIVLAVILTGLALSYVLQYFL
jgi:uncharacterized membrane protein YfcA